MFLCLRTLFWNINEFSDVMGMLKAIGVEKSYSRNGSQSKMIPIELDYDGVEKSYSRNGSQSKMIPIELDYDGYTILLYFSI